jgi:hypothetical protein
MSRTISSNAREQVQFTEMTDVLLVLLEIDHDDLTTPIRIVNNNQNITYETNTYYASNFEFGPPTQEAGEISSATLSFSNIDRTLITSLRSISTPPEITVNIVFSGDTTVVKEAGPWVFYLQDISYNVNTITGTLAYRFSPKKKASTIIMNYNEFPSMIPVI